MEFKGPKTYKPSFASQRSPSRAEMWKGELGFEEDDSTDSLETSDEDPEVDQISNNVTMVELHSLHLEIKKKDKDREELLLKLKVLSDKTASYRARLNKSEQNKKSQMKIMKKTHEVFIEQKDRLITDLQDILAEHENTLAAQEGKGKKKGKGTKTTALLGINRLVESITELHDEKAKLTESLLVIQSELEDMKDEAKDTASKYRNQISDLQIEIKRLKSSSEQDHVGKENINVSSDRIARLEEENRSLRNERKNMESEMWKTQESLRDEIRRLEDEIKSTSKKMRDAETKYVNLAATPPKVQVRTVPVVSEEIKRKLEETEEQNRKLEGLLEQSKMEHNSKIKDLESKQLCLLEQMKTDHNSKIRDLESKQLCLLEQMKTDHNLKIRDLESKQLCLLEQMKTDHDSKVKKLQMEILGIKEKCQQEIDRISEEKQAEITKIKLEAERTTRGLRKLYQSLQENCLRLMKESQELKKYQGDLKRTCLNFTSSLKPICDDTHKQIVGKVSGIDQMNKEFERRYIKEMKLRKRLHNELVDLKGNIRVYCRVRPFISEDGVANSSRTPSIITFDERDDGVLSVSNKGTVKHFEMEKVFQPTSTQEEVYSEVQELVVSCLDGYNICIFAYGQTGSGKTFTMEGPANNPGINQRALRHLFKTIEEKSLSRDWVYLVTVNVLEIYNETIRDLLSSDQNQKLEMKLGADGLNYVRGLTDFQVDNIDHVNELFALGKKNRATAITNMNEHSSRSHAILRVTVSGTHNASGTTVTGKLNLVDLAGSERVDKSGSEGLRMKEAQNINKSLSSLGDVIHALKNKHAHVPYRNSKLTFLLQDSLGGDSKTLMVVQVSPALKNIGETLCSLNFAQRVRMVELGQASKKIETTAEQKPTTPNKAKRNGTPRR